jgi:tRNA modification GTPase
MARGQVSDTIAAVATAPGIGGVAIVRVSGPLASRICQALTGSCPSPRRARFSDFRDHLGDLVDQGIVLYFAAPQSFTGEDVVELQCHGGTVISDMLLEQVVRQGGRLARPGEFSERAFLNGRMDLVQAEAVADLIESSTRAAARLALRSLAGEFSMRVHECADSILSIRVFVEAAIDFPEEEIDFLSQSDIADRLEQVLSLVKRTRDECERGAMLRNGLDVVLCGPPNAGKSSLLNALARNQRAIVSATPGTTRDLVNETVRVGGIVVNLVDTAGLHDTCDEVEREGIRRARDAIDRADLALVVYDDSAGRHELEGLLAELPDSTPRLVVCNKIDLRGREPGNCHGNGDILVSAKTGAGIDSLEAALLDHAGSRDQSDDMFLARRRHLDAIERALGHLLAANGEVPRGHWELTAESLRLAHLSLGEITGEVSSDELLGRIFSSFCIGK